MNSKKFDLLQYFKEHGSGTRWLSDDTVLIANGIEIDGSLDLIDFRFRISCNKISKKKAKAHIPVKYFNSLHVSLRDTLVYYVDEDDDIYLNKDTEVYPESQANRTFISAYNRIFLAPGDQSYIPIDTFTYIRPSVNIYNGKDKNYIAVADVPKLEETYNQLCQKYGIHPLCKLEAYEEYWEEYKAILESNPNLIPVGAKDPRWDIAIKRTLHTYWVDKRDVETPISKYISHNNPDHKFYITIANHILKDPEACLQKLKKYKMEIKLLTWNKTSSD